MRQLEAEAPSAIAERAVTVMVIATNGLTHTLADDVDVLLVGPTGASVVFMSDAGSARRALRKRR